MPFIWRWDTGGGGRGGWGGAEQGGGEGGAEGAGERGGGGGGGGGEGGGRGSRGNRSYEEFLGWGVGKPWAEVDVACAVAGREGPVGVAAGLVCDDNPSFTEVSFDTVVGLF
jgi:hypothetical protein